MNIIEGDLIELGIEGAFDVIVHGCNCFNTMGSGIAVPMRNNFGVNNYELEGSRYKGDYNKLGQIDYEKHPTHNIYVVNAYTQYDYNRNVDPEAVMLDYTALVMCLKKLNHTFKGKSIGIPKIGCGRAGGDWKIVLGLIEKHLTNMNVTIVIK